MKKRIKVLLIFLISLLVLLLPFLALSYIGSQTKQLHEAEHFFKNNQSVLEDSISALESTLPNSLAQNNEDNFIEPHLGDEV